jgi:hypothetical protein
MKNKIYQITVRKITKSNIKIVERAIIETPNTQIHDQPLSWLSALFVILYNISGC